jgi:hypothetical protein
MLKSLFLLTTTLALGSLAAAPVKIMALPFNITAPGTYELTANLVSVSGQGAVTINSPKVGAIIVDLEGYTISQTGTSTGVYVVSNATSSSITIRNGTLQNFPTGVVAGQAAATVYLSNIHLQSLILNNCTYAGVTFFLIGGSTINNCSFQKTNGSTALYGIEDFYGPGGNSYSNNSFDGNEQFELAVSSANNTPVILDHFHLEPATN